MKKYLWILFFLILIIGIGIFAFNNSNTAKNSYIAGKTGSSDQDLKVEDWNLENTNKDNNQEQNIEKELSSFSTELPNDTKARDDNIKLACKTLNGTKVNSKDTFSLWKILGCPTKEKGYQEAKTFTSDGEITQSYGGGICQISTTLYNAVLEVEGLEITERHEHSREVTYIKDGKDAAVSYGSADLKFKNTLDYDIKIEAQVENRKVKIRLIRIS